MRSVAILPWPKCRNLTCGLMIWFVRHSNHRFSTMYPTSHLNGGRIIWWCASAIDLQKSQYYLNIFCLCIFEYPFLNNQPVSKRRTSRYYYLYIKECFRSMEGRNSSWLLTNNKWKNNDDFSYIFHFTVSLFVVVILQWNWTNTEIIPFPIIRISGSFCISIQDDKLSPY